MNVSVVVPVYNVAKYVERCFDSVTSQSYSNKDIECIFVDDCGPDNSVELLQQKISSYSGEIDFRIINHRKNKGLSGARNTGTEAATGEYIYYLDSDDEITPMCLGVLVELAQKYSGVDIIQGNTTILPEPKPEGNWRDIKGSCFPEYSSDKLWIKERCFESPRIPVNAWNKLIKKEFLLKNNLFFREGIIHEDEQWMFFVAKKINDIAFSEEYCYVHYVVPGSIMQLGKSNYNSLNSALIVIKEMSDNIDNELANLQRKHFYRYLNISIGRIGRIVSKDDKKAFSKSYIAFVKELLLSSIKRFNFYEVVLNISLLIPNSRFAREISKRLIRYI